MDLGDYVKRELKKGFSRKEIKNALLKAGHKEERIDAALAKQQKFKKALPAFKTGIILALVLIVIGGTIWVFVTQSYEYRLGEEEEQCLQDVKDIRLHFLAVKQQNANLCKEISSTDYRTYCLAEVTKNPESCKGLLGLQERYCMFFITADINDCRALESAPFCEMLVQGSPEPCEKIDWLADEKNGCIARASLDETYYENDAYFAEHCKNIAAFRTPA